jgi:hypothetical protein
MAIKTDASSIWAEYQRGLNYQNKMGFASKWPENIRMVEGNQWPPATEKTKYMPRPVINQLDFIVENKQSNILGQSLKMVFSPEEMPEDADTEELNKAADDMTDAAQNTWNDIDQDTLNEDCVNDVLTIGTGILHYYYDNSVTGGVYTKYVGGIRGEVIDPMDIFLGNPQLKPHQTQKQPWIIVRTREDADLVREYAKKNGENWELIQPDDKDDSKYDNSQNDIEEANKVTCLTKYYKDKSQIYWVKVTESAIVQKPRPLSPGTTPFTLYPIEIVVFKRRKKCTFGRAIIEDIIPNQKALNWGLGMMLLSVQQTAWPKIIAKMTALQQSITNEPGEILTDYGNPGTDNIKYMQPPNFSTTPVLLAEKIMDMTRQVTGTTEVNSGEVIGANMAAAAIIALQNQARKPNEKYEKIFGRSIKNVGRIWEMFYKTYFNMPRPITTKDETGKEVTRTFTGSEYADMGFGLSIDVGPASVFNESLQVSIIDKMYDKGDLDKYGYVKYLPKNTVSSELRQDFEKEAENLKNEPVNEAPKALPSLAINFKDMPPEGQVQLAALAGIQINQPAPQQDQQAIIDDAISQLSPDKLAELEANPALMEEFVNNVIGGTQNGMQGM